MLIEITVAKTKEDLWQAEVIGSNFGPVIKPVKNEAIDLLKYVILSEVLNASMPLPNSIVFVMSDRFEVQDEKQATP